MTNLSATPPAAPVSATRERLILWLLALTQFTVIMDFMVMMPLAPQLMQAFGKTPAAVSGAVSVYSWCAGLSGLLAMTYIDRFDRKRLLLTMFLLFTISNLACALAPNFHVLVLSRAFAGLTGGVLGAICMAIIGDLVPPERRGAATGIVMTSFSLAAIAGVPAGVMMSAHFGWQSAFYLLVGFSVLIWCVALRALPSMSSHLKAAPVPVARILPELVGMFRVPAHLKAFALSGMTMMSGMLVIPFISPVLVANYGVQPAEITWIYLAGGLATLFSARRIGAWADRAGKQRVFRWVAAFSILPLMLITHLPHVPLIGMVLMFPFFMTALSGRTVPLQALMTTVPEQSRRGAFLSANSAVQQVGTGLGAFVGGLWLSTDAAGHISGYGYNGWAAAALTLMAILWISRVQSAAVTAPVAIRSAA